jgi:hypothetical protein
MASVLTLLLPASRTCAQVAPPSAVLKTPAKSGAA